MITNRRQWLAETVMAGSIILAAFSSCLGADAETNISKMGQYVASNAAPDRLTTKKDFDWEAGTLQVKGGTPTPVRPADRHRVRLSSIGGPRAVFSGRSTDWGCAYVINGSWVINGVDQGTYPKGVGVWVSKFEAKPDPRLALEVNGEGRDDDAIAVGDNTGTATITLLGQVTGSGPWNATLSDSTSHISVPPPIALTPGVTKEVKIGGITPGTGRLVATCGAMRSPIVPVTVGSIVIAPVVRDDFMPYSLAPGKSKRINVTFSRNFVGAAVSFKVEGGSPDNGTASLTSDGEGPSKDGTGAYVTVMGGKQTNAGHGGNLFITAYVNSVKIGSSAGFTVCAHPASLVYSGAVPWPDDPTQAEILVYGHITSDSLPLDNCINLGEMCGVIPETNGSLTGQVFMLETSDYSLKITGEHSEVTDLLDSIGLPRITVQRTQAQGSYTSHQVLLFSCDRCGIVRTDPAAVPNSGNKRVISELPPASATVVPVQVDITPNKEVVNGFASDPATVAPNPLSGTVNVTVTKK